MRKIALPFNETERVVTSLNDRIIKWMSTMRYPFTRSHRGAPSTLFSLGD